MREAGCAYDTSGGTDGAVDAVGGCHGTADWRNVGIAPFVPPPQAASTFWVWHFLRGGHGVCGTLRIGGVLAAIVWWCRTAGFSVSPQSQNALVLLMSLAALVALFNAGRRAELSSVGEVVFCGALGAAWMVTLGAGLYWLLFP